MCMTATVVTHRGIMITGFLGILFGNDNCILVSLSMLSCFLSTSVFFFKWYNSIFSVTFYMFLRIKYSNVGQHIVTKGSETFSNTLLGRKLFFYYFCINFDWNFFFTHLPLVPHICRWTGSALVQVMAYRLSGAKPLPQPMLEYCQLDP